MLCFTEKRCLYPRELDVRLLTLRHLSLLCFFCFPHHCYFSQVWESVSLSFCFWWIQHSSDSTNTRFMTAFPFPELMKVFPHFSLTRGATFAPGAGRISTRSLGNCKKKSKEQTNRLNLIYSVKGLMLHCHRIFISYFQRCLFRSSLVQSCARTHRRDNHVSLGDYWLGGFDVVRLCIKLN